MSSPALTRRALLAGAGTTFASAALAVPYVNAAHSEEVSATAFDPETRYERAVAELRAAALALQPDLDVWNINRTAMGVLVWGYSSEEAAKPLTVKWDGNGVYATIDGDKRPVWHITRATRFDDGDERWFCLSSGFKGSLEPADWYCPESGLPALTRKIRVLA